MSFGSIIFFFPFTFTHSKQWKIISLPFSFYLIFLSSKHTYEKYKFILFISTQLHSSQLSFFQILSFIQTYPNNVFGRSDLRWKEREEKEIRWKERNFGCLVEVKKGEEDWEQCISVHGTYINSAISFFFFSLIPSEKQQGRGAVFIFIILPSNISRETWDEMGMMIGRELGCATPLKVLHGSSLFCLNNFNSSIIILLKINTKKIQSTSYIKF